MIPATVRASAMDDPVWITPSWIEVGREIKVPSAMDSGFFEFVYSLPVRCRLAISVMDIKSFSDLRSKSRRDFLKLRNVGPVSLKQLATAMRARGFNVDHWGFL